MNLSFNKLMLAVCFSGTLILTSVTGTRAEVVVFDGVTTVQTPIRIKVLTKGRIFSEGGRLVDLYLDDNHLKKILTGADGYGYFKYIPQSPGFKEITARADGISASGLILVMGKSEKAIIIDVEGAFKDTIFSEKLQADSRKVVKALSQDYQVIYLSRYVGKDISKRWLARKDFPKSAVLRWQGPNTFKKLDKRGVHLYAVIGSAALISAAKKHIEHRYTFEESKDGKIVKDWDEILNLLKPSGPAVSQEKDPV
ncbi:hypothetical protein D1BOALGB6SA_3324 [Olavius sp. associated proteobacterium Delta 1]|nr:hypothetical protein D1BOALGB6SA_3324 [Olavius sp. associated proteobacterium Delta 1]